MKPARKQRVYFEDVKTRHTTHWDLDYLSLVDLEKMYGKNRWQGAAGERQSKRPSRRRILIAVLAGAAAVLLAALGILVLRL